MKKQLIGLILPLFICALMPSGATAAPYTISYSGPSHIPPGGSGTFTFTVKKGGIPQSGVTVRILCREDHIGGGYIDVLGCLSNDMPVTDTNGQAQTTLTVESGASGSYRITASARDREGDQDIDYVRFDVIVGNPPTSSSSGTTSSLSGTTSSLSGTTSPPPAPKLVRISDDNQVTSPDDSMILTVELRDSHGSPTSDVDVTFFILAGDRSRASLSPARATTDATGRAQTTLTFGTGAAGDYIVQAYRSDTSGIYTQFTVTVDPLLPKATRLEKISGDNQIGLIGGVWAAPFVVEVRDQYDAPLAGTTVTFTILTGGGILTAETTTTYANGQTGSTLRLGTEPGTNTVEVSVEGIPETVTFTAEVPLPPPMPTVPLIASGDNQSDLTGEALANPFVVEVRDQYDAPMEGVTVTFTINAGSGSLSDTSVKTDANGLAQSTLTLGSDPGTNTVEASVEGLSQMVVFNAEASLPLPMPTDLSIVSGDNQSDLTGEALANPFVAEVRDQYDAPMEGITVTFVVSAGGGTLSATTATTNADGQAESTLTLGDDPGTNTVDVSVARITETETFNAIAKLLEFDLSLPSGISLIHVPLRVKTVDGVARTIESLSDLYDVLGGADAVNWIISHDSETQNWHSYFGDADRRTATDTILTDHTGILVSMKAPVSIRLSGNALGVDGMSTVTLNPGLNLVGLPLKDSRVTRVSDLFALEGVADNADVIIVSDNGEFKVVGRAGDPGDIAITGGQSFILTAQATATVTISGDGWDNTASGTMAAPPILTQGFQMTGITPVLALNGLIVDSVRGINSVGLRVSVKNLSTGSAVTTMVGNTSSTSSQVGYRLTVVDIERGQAAAIGDALEISVISSDTSIGVEPLRYIVTAEDVRRSRIQLPSLVLQGLPSETELLRNYPNPFNPETWIPYRLAQDAFVTLTIYNGSGQVVRTLDVGHQSAAVYESRSKAIYWDGRNDLGESVASGLYFYTLTTGDFSATRKMVILK